MKDFKQFNEEVYQPNVDNTTTPPTGEIGGEVMDPYESDMIVQDIKDAIDSIYNTYFDSFNTREEFDDLVKSIL